MSRMRDEQSGGGVCAPGALPAAAATRQAGEEPGPEDRDGRTGRRVTDEERRAAEEFNRRIIEASPDCIKVMDLEGRLQSMSAGGQQLLEIDDFEPYRGARWQDFWQGEQHEAAARAVVEARAGGMARFEGRCPTVKGTPKWWEVVIAPLRDARGLPERLIAISRDVTVRWLADEALRASEQRLNRAQEIAHLGSWELDHETGRLDWSDEVYRIFGMAPREFGASYEAFLDAVHPDDRTAVNDAYTGSLREGRDTYEIEHRVVRRSTGEVRVVREKCDHFRDGSGRVVRSVGMVHDITEYATAVELLRQSERRQRELAAALRDTDRRKDEFIAALSHELRNPLAPIGYSLFVLRQAQPGGEQARHALAVIERQLGHLGCIVDDLLDVTRISRGMVRLQHRSIDLVEVVRGVAEDHRGVFVAAGVRFEVRLAAIPMRLDADATRLAQVVGNLLQNAAKFTPRGGSVELALDREGNAGVLRIADTGVGLDAEVMSRLFQPFSQGCQSLDRSRGGLGLGLALAKGLVELHGGTVEAASGGGGCGATFTVRLPLSAEYEPAVAGPPTACGACRRVLIIEDNDDAADTLREALSLSGHVVRTARDGPSGIEAAREFRPEVVLCDIGLPGMDGFEVARTFRADARLREARLVAVSGYALPEDLERSSAAGFDHHLAKPPSLAQIEDLLQGRAPPRSNGAADGPGTPR
ncbi:MAG: PAS domain-containing protein [Deltaproteobacteria bacterium]|nr:PAS domain-containing protein [Deltaproteobacteria bacterium]